MLWHFIQENWKHGSEFLIRKREVWVEGISIKRIFITNFKIMVY
jgi:hypothetical protein